MEKNRVAIKYEISFKDGRRQDFTIELDPDTSLLVTKPRTNYPQWTNLTWEQCPNCPLNPQTHAQCPVAANLLDVTQAFSRNISYEEVKVTIRTQARNYQRDISLQDALRSLFGVYMATSGCPIMDKLRPLAAIHLPFATCQETAYRALAMYALAQVFILKHGGIPDWEFKDLGKIYKEVEAVNRAFHHRLVSAGLEDASLNAVGNLNCYAQFTQMLLEPERLKKIECLFSAYYPGPKKE